MGRAIRAALSEFPDVVLRACVARSRDASDCPAGCVWMTPADWSESRGDLPRDLVVIDVSLPLGTARLLDRLERLPLALVSATTGLGDAEEERVRALAYRVAVLRARNLSPGNAIASAMLRSIPGASKDLFEIDVIEHHHAAKRDAPSGTALAWASILAPGRAPGSSAAGEKPAGARAEGEIRIHSVRSGTAPGTHRALLAGAGETLEVIHTVSDRAVFARGALLAARFLHARAPGFYSFDDVLQSP